jgi:hypothetical protein
MIIVKAAAGLVIELGAGESGRLDLLSVRLSEGLAARPFSFEVYEDAARRLLFRPLEAREPGELIAALGAVVANESNILAEVRKYNPPRA